MLLVFVFKFHDLYCKYLIKNLFTKFQPLRQNILIDLIFSKKNNLSPLYIFFIETFSIIVGKYIFCIIICSLFINNSEQLNIESGKEAFCAFGM